MTPEAWRRIETVYAEAREREPAERAEYLSRVCEGDAELRARIEQMLQLDSDGLILDEPAFEWDGSVLPHGAELGPYRIDEVIGQGGMGKVYRATDTRLNRTVAIKVSRAVFDPRFRSEARTIATLNHANICTLYDVGPNFLVMELVEGETLQSRLRKGPLSQAETRRIAGQVANALEAAHEKGVVHRDLKPGNVMIRPDGVVKVLDFGLAKASRMELVAADTGSFGTISDPTKPGLIFGSPAYMSPEQASAKPVDRRSDIYSFGSVVYEMLTGRRLHPGGTTSETLASVLRDEPQWEGVPFEFEKLLRRCLVKEPIERLRHIGDVMSLVDDSPPRNVRTPKWIWAAAAATLVALSAGALLFWSGQKPPVQPTSLIRFGVPIPGGSAATAHFALSPDGNKIVISADQDGARRLYVRALGSLEARGMPGTEGAQAPIWSADGNEIVFRVGNSLKELNLASSRITTFFEGVNTTYYGGSWGSSGLLFSSDGSIHFLASKQGATRKLYDRGGFGSLSNPVWLPGERTFLFTAEGHPSNPKSTGIYAGFVDGRTAVRLLEDRSRARYVAAENSDAGWLLCRRNGKLVAQPFDPAMLKITGPAVQITEEEVISEPGYGPNTSFSVSTTGTLAYQAKTLEQLVWLDRAGKVVEMVGQPSELKDFRLSRDGKRVAIDVSHFDSYPSATDVAWRDLERGTLLRLTTNGDADLVPVFSNRGDWVAFASRRLGDFNPFITNGPDQEKLLAETPGPAGWPLDWSPKDDFLLWEGDGLWEVPVPPNQSAIRQLVDGRYQPRGGQYSPVDGKWIAYSSKESGIEEVFLRRFPDGPRLTVSVDGGKEPAWRRDGRELFYVDRHGVLTSVPVAVNGTGVSFGKEEKLFPAPAGTFRRNYEVSPDGKRFLVAQPADPLGAAITVVTNWQALLSR